MRKIRTAQSLFTGRQLLIVIGLLVCLPTVADAIQLPTFSFRGNDCVKVAGLVWHTDYAAACDEAQSRKKMLLVNFVPRAGSDAQRGLEKFLHENAGVRTELDDYVLVRVFDDERVGILNLGILRRSRGRLINDPAFKYLGRKPGLAMIDYRDAKASYYGDVVTALPFKNGKYYRWENSNLTVALGVPAGTITQRMMVWAVRMHPEKPRSTLGTQSPELLALATKHSAYQAQIGMQGHQNFEYRAAKVRLVTHSAQVSEVVAESWPNQDLIDSCIDCVLSWRQSPGHWAGVSSRHRLFAYDIRKGNNGIWYGTGLYAN